jgi:hypothetical protein
MKVFFKLVMGGLIFFIISQAPLLFLDQLLSALVWLFWLPNELGAFETIFQVFQVYPLFLIFFFFYVMAGVFLDFIELNG